jgi:hypothetical protein
VSPVLVPGVSKSFPAAQEASTSRDSQTVEYAPEFAHAASPACEGAGTPRTPRSIGYGVTVA